MAWALVAGSAISLAPSIYKGIKGAGQSRKANGMNPVNPGYQVNTGVIDNARQVSDMYGNYRLPGYSQQVSDINTTFNNAFESGVQGASSGGDVLDLATRMAYGKNTAFNRLGQQNAEGKANLFGTYLNANAAAGQEYVNKNAYDRDIYQGQVREKAALTQAGAENTYGAIDSAAGAIGKFAFSQVGTKAPNTKGVTGTPYDDAYNSRFYVDGSPRFDAFGNPLPPPIM